MLRDETTWGVSAAGTTLMFQVISSSIESNPNKTLVEDTHTSNKGRDRMVRLREEINGDINAYGSPKVLNKFFELAMGTQGSTGALGSSAMLITYNQNTDGNLASVTLVKDRNNSSEVFYGVRANKLSLKASDGLIEATLGVLGKTRSNGPVLPDVLGETVKPFIFADVTFTVGRGSANTNPVTLNVSEWSLNYENGLEAAFLSGSRTATRMDPMVPKVEGEFKIFHEGTSWVSAVYGASEMYIRITASTDSSEGLIAGITPYYMQVDIPRVELTTTTRNYEQAAMSVETVKFVGMFDAGLSALIRPQMTVGFDIES